MPKTSPSRDVMSPSTWTQLIAAHTEAARRFQHASAAAGKGAPALEEEADIALQELARLEGHALAWPAKEAVAFRFKLALWGDRVEGHEEEWRVFVDDCEQLLATKRR